MRFPLPASMHSTLPLIHCVLAVFSYLLFYYTCPLLPLHLLFLSPILLLLRLLLLHLLPLFALAVLSAEISSPDFHMAHSFQVIQVLGQISPPKRKFLACPLLSYSTPNHSLIFVITSVVI